MDPELAAMMRVKPAPLLLHQQVLLGSTITALSPSPDGSSIAVGSCDAEVHIYDAQLTLRCTCAGHEGGTNGVAWLVGGRLASVGEDGMLRVWDPASGSQLAALECEGVDVDKGPDGHSVTCLAVSPCGATMVAAAGKTLHILPTQLEGMEAGRRMLPPVSGGVVADVRFVGETRLLLAYYGGVSLASTEPGIGTLQLEYGTSVLAADATPNLTWLVGGCMDASVHIWHFTQQPQGQDDQELDPGRDAGAPQPTPPPPAAAAGDGPAGPSSSSAEGAPGHAAEEGPGGDPGSPPTSAAASAVMGAGTTMVQFACGGYDTKVAALAFDAARTQLASAGGTSMTVWPFDGPEGPAGATPVVTLGHERLVTVLGWQPCAPGLVASGGKDGYLLVYDTSNYAEPDEPGCPKFCGPVALAADTNSSPVTALAWGTVPPARRLYSGDEAGHVCCWELPPHIGAPPPPPGGPPPAVMQQATSA